jgi:hypothetical protein
LARGWFEADLAQCARAGLPGVHVITAAGARNVAFYQRCGFDVSVARRWQAKKLLLLAARLSAGIPKQPPAVGDRSS